MAARSPALASTGPEVARKFTPSSRATIWARVVLPRPGGPNSSTWSSASPRPRAASMKTLRLALACSWPTNSARVWGRSALSVAASNGGSGSRRRLSAGSPAQLLQRRLDQGRTARRPRPGGAGPVDGAAGGDLGDAQAHQGGDRLAGDAGRRRAARRAAWAWKAATGPSPIGLPFSSVTMRRASLGPTPLARGRPRPCRRARRPRPARPAAGRRAPPAPPWARRPGWPAAARRRGAPRGSGSRRAACPVCSPTGSRRAAAPRRRAPAGATGCATPQRTT